MSNFRDTDEFEKQWNCRQTGSKKEKNLKVLPATEKSFIEGYYQSSREFTKDNKKYVVHKILATKIGDPDHSDPIKDQNGEIREFFGTTVINKKLAEKTQPGQLVRIQWLGYVEPKGGGDKYQDWKLFIDDSAAPRILGASTSNNKNVEASNNQEKTEATVSNTDEDDDLPF